MVQLARIDEELGWATEVENPSLPAVSSGVIPRPKFDEAVAKGRCGSQRSGSPADSGLENGRIAE